MEESAIVVDPTLPPAQDALHAQPPRRASAPRRWTRARGYVTIINTCLLAPERAEALLDMLLRSTIETLRHVPGFISSNLHMNLNCTQVVNYAEWRSREDIAAARNDPAVAACMREAAEIADSFAPVQDELRRFLAAAGG